MMIDAGEKRCVLVLAVMSLVAIMLYHVPSSNDGKWQFGISIVHRLAGSCSSSFGLQFDLQTPRVVSNPAAACS